MSETKVKELTLKSATELKRSLESEILELIATFELATNKSVDRIEILHRAYFHKNITTGVQIEVRL